MVSPLGLSVHDHSIPGMALDYLYRVGTCKSVHIRMMNRKYAVLQIFTVLNLSIIHFFQPLYLDPKVFQLFRVNMPGVRIRRANCLFVQKVVVNNKM